MQRCEELSRSTSSPEPFAVMMYLETADPLGLERHMHKVFERFRTNESREFFSAGLREIYKEFEAWETEGCMLCVSHMARGLMLVADYDDRAKPMTSTSFKMGHSPCNLLS